MFEYRACVGRNLATLEMTIIIASIFHRYEFVLDYPGQKVRELREGCTSTLRISLAGYC
jgi:benzoate 4-monooxygenase